MHHWSPEMNLVFDSCTSTFLNSRNNFSLDFLITPHPFDFLADDKDASPNRALAG